MTIQLFSNMKYKLIFTRTHTSHKLLSTIEKQKYFYEEIFRGHRPLER